MARRVQCRRESAADGRRQPPKCTHQWEQCADDQVSEEHVKRQFLVRAAGAICQCPQALAISAADVMMEACARGVQFLVDPRSTRGLVRVHPAIVQPPPYACDEPAGSAGDSARRKAIHSSM